MQLVICTLHIENIRYLVFNDSDILTCSILSSNNFTSLTKSTLWNAKNARRLPTHCNKALNIMHNRSTAVSILLLEI